MQRGINNMDKSEIRKEMLDKRASLTQDKVKEISQMICIAVRVLESYKTAKNVCLYMPIKNEVDVRYVMEDARHEGKDIWLPKVNGKNMDFYSYGMNTKLIKGSYGILEPDSNEILIPDKKTFIVMPGAAFSEKHDRIGYGGGYYDRFLNKHNMCMTAAVCYNFQILPQIPVESYDIRPDVIVSEERILL